ncbi:MAG: alpha/beta hydrolase [Eubacterium sp.]|nr:alpha/beta hydrolase [Eubacterium sp.]
MITVNKPSDCEAKYILIPFGRHKIKVLTVKPKGLGQQDRVPGVLWLHGGGYLTGMCEMVYMSRAIDLVARCGAVVVCPEYTLSPIAPYPRALKECYTALLYMKEHANALNIRPDQIIVGGESAGGGLTAALCMYARDKGTVNIAFQLPLYPMLDCYDTDSSKDNHAKVWNTKRNHYAWQLYLRSIKDKSRVPAYASPARQTDYANLPPCYTFVGDIEPFYCETLAYINNLKNAGVDARVDVYEGFYHAFDMMQPQDERAKQAADQFVTCFKEYCAKYYAKQD